jgi:REP element-mobilizing transposase RayT
MARTLRLEVEGGVYHVLNRGNYRAEVFGEENTRRAFLSCLEEACARTGWVVHAWCVMSNHYHLALETPDGNLVEGMRWLQGTFATRFNRLRQERGHLFQGRYKSLIVDPCEGLGPLCHYIHLNPVRAGLCRVEELGAWPWSSMHWATRPRRRPPWYRVEAALQHAGGLGDDAGGRRKYLEYLGWLVEDEAARKALAFDRMSKGWVIGGRSFKQDVVAEHREVARALERGDRTAAELQEALLDERLDRLLAKIGRRREEATAAAKSVPWKLAVAAAMKATTTATNRWLAGRLHMGSLHETSRRVSAWSRAPDAKLARKLGLSTKHKT